MGESKIVRWLRENRADTRTPGPPEGGRYAAPFAGVWDEILALVRRRSRWTLVHSDETEGLLTVKCRSRLFNLVDDMSVWVSLDEDGLTRVEVRSRARSGHGDLGVNERRIRRLMRHLDESFERV